MEMIGRLSRLSKRLRCRQIKRALRSQKPDAVIAAIEKALTLEVDDRVDLILPLTNSQFPEIKKRAVAALGRTPHVAVVTKLGRDIQSADCTATIIFSREK